MDCLTALRTCDTDSRGEGLNANDNDMLVKLNDTAEAIKPGDEHIRGHSVKDKYRAENGEFRNSQRSRYQPHVVAYKDSHTVGPVPASPTPTTR